MNRCLAEGRERFRRLLASSEDGSRCDEMRLLLSAFCDAETSPEETARVREHLRACAACRATMRAYRAAPATVAALAPALAVSRSLLERAQELLVGIQSRLPTAGGAADAPLTQVAAAGGAKGVGTAVVAKLLAVCAATVGGAACVASGVAPAPLDLMPDRVEAPRLERVSGRAIKQLAAGALEEERATVPAAPKRLGRAPTEAAQKAIEPEDNVAETGAVEPGEPEAAPAPPPAAPEPPAPPAPPSTAPQGAPSGSAAGEFGP